MPCNCHTKSGAVVKVAKPYDQCVLCARKHVKNAWGAWHEFTYEEDNRDYISDQLRKAVEHLKFTYRDMALECRDLAMIIEDNRDLEAPDMSARLTSLKDRLKGLYYMEHSDAQERITALEAGADVIIPLNNGSCAGNDELRLMLRSLDMHLKHCGRVFLVTERANVPNWLDLTDMILVEVADNYIGNKDANLHGKVMRVLEEYPDVGNFIFASDDNVFVQDICAGALPVLHSRDCEYFEQSGDNLNKWQRRVKNTLIWARNRGAHLNFHYECHAPQLFDGNVLRYELPKLDFGNNAGLTIYTCWRTLTGTWKNSLPQAVHKLTFEGDCSGMLKDTSEAELRSRLFIGYNDDGFKSGLRERLFAMFPDKSKYEI